MKAIKYLQKLGAIPKFDPWDLKMAIIVIADELYCEESVMEPDCLDWVQEVNEDMDLFNQRCELVLYSTSSNLEKLMETMEPIQDVSLLTELIQQLIELRLFYFSLESDSFPDGCQSEEEWFTKLYNDFVGLKPPQHFESRSEVFMFYYGGSLTPVGESALKSKNVSVVREGKRT